MGTGLLGGVRGSRHALWGVWCGRRSAGGVVWYDVVRGSPRGWLAPYPGPKHASPRMDAWFMVEEGSGVVGWGVGLTARPEVCSVWCGCVVLEGMAFWGRPQPPPPPTQRPRRPCSSAQYNIFHALQAHRDGAEATPLG